MKCSVLFLPRSIGRPLKRRLPPSQDCCLQCVSILVNYLEQRDWQAAFEATVPQRKRAGGTKDSGDLTIELEEGPEASASAEDGCDIEENGKRCHANPEDSNHDASASAGNGCTDEPQAKRPRVEAEEGTAAVVSAEGGVEQKETTRYQTDAEAAGTDLRQV